MNNGNAAQSEPISELEQELDNSQFYDLMQQYRMAPLTQQEYVSECYRAVISYIAQREKVAFQDGVNKALEALPEKYEESEHGLAPHEEPYNKAISQAKENLGAIEDRINQLTTKRRSE